jgi:uncharacterized repeat protein (TIGR01451 family)
VNVVPGQTATYTLTVSNTDPSDALDVAIVDALPAGTTFVSLVQNSGPAFSISTPGVGTNGTVTLDATMLASGTTATFTLVVSVDPALTAATLTNTADGTTSTTDTNTNNNTGTVISNVTPQADLQIVKSGPASVIPGQQLTYTIVVSNNGSSNSPNSTIADSFAGDLSNVTWTAVFAGGATGNTSGSGDISEHVDLPCGSSITYTVTGLVHLLATGTLDNTATVTPPGAVTDLDLNNNSSTASTMLLTQIVAYGTGPGIEGKVTVVNSITQELLFEITPFPGFLGGVRVAVADVNGDMIPDIIVSAGPGGGPHVRVFDGADGTTELLSFFAYDAAFTGGVFVAAADLNSDGKADIITGAGSSGGPHVRAFSGDDSDTVLFNFMAYDSGQLGEAGNFTGGVHVAAGDISGDGVPDIITGAGPGGGPHVRVFDGATPQLTGRGEDISQTMANPLGSFFGYDAGFAGGVFVAAGDVNGDGRIDLITGAGPGGGPHVRVFDGSTMAQMTGGIGSFFAYDPGFAGGVRVAATDITGDGKADIITAAGQGGGPHVRAFQADSSGPEGIRSVFVEDPAFTGGIFVAASTNLESTVSPLILAPGFHRNVDADVLTLDELQTVYQAAVNRLEALGLSASSVDSVSSIALEVADLTGDQLGQSVPGTIRVDINAAGIGWYVDSTPLLDDEFTGDTLASANNELSGGVDLLTVLLHEIIHQLGGEHVHGTIHSGSLMAETLAPAQRRLPNSGELDQLFANSELFDELLAS